MCFLVFFRRVDIGYSYTTDGGITYPLRGQNQVIPTLHEVLDDFIPKESLCFFFDMKAVDAVEVSKNYYHIFFGTLIFEQS